MVSADGNGGGGRKARQLGVAIGAARAKQAKYILPPFPGFPGTEKGAAGIQSVGGGRFGGKFPLLIPPENLL